MQLSKNLLIKNKLGLHARAATQLVKVSQAYPCEIILECDGKSANANSVMGLLMLAGATGTEITVHCNGEQAEQALQAVEDLINARFHEGE
ncbi:phosphocarrier protein NPr [Catenovulum agarivorans DS-2]|uniref:Phosphocarrier protein NPr n=1 Tax=Catenovulum agarivorans DS-2 TaxID=1328313 RepID=W7Q8K3_9ALTE|nr:HPr family phosphocarrier protein [Catenovulum agarivorans]EWH09124.1 phosphocarrier protein NPr [Catenovulum agarivorans DS-2]